MKKILLPLLLSPLLLVSGCATTALGRFPQLITPSSTAVVLGAVDLALGQAVFNNPVTNKVKAIAVKAIAAQVMLDTSNPAATVATVEANLMKRIEMANPADAQAFIAFTRAVQVVLDKAAATPVSGVTNNTLVAINGIAKEVVRVAGLYGA